VKSLIFWIFLVSSLLYGTSTTTQIKNSKKDLSKMNSAKKKANRKLDEIVKDIKEAENEVALLDKKLEQLSIEKEKTEDEYQKLKYELEHSEEILAQTNEEIEKKRKDFISLLSEQFSIIFAMKQFDTPTEKSIISYEVYKAYKKHNENVLQRLRDEIATLKKSKKDKILKRDMAKKSIAKFETTRQMYVKKKKKQEKLMARLNADEEKYQERLQKIADKQGSLRSTLAKLNILRSNEVAEAKKRAKARREAMRLEKKRLRKIRKERALARKKAREAKKAIRLAKTAAARRAAKAKAKKAEKEVARTQRSVGIASERVRKVNSSYKRGSTIAYRGGKTISPIRGAKVIKKFGTYVDPIYKIKIFNESITLKAPKSNAKVQNVLNGKVVFAGKSSMLGKVVVVAHSGKMHTVYAGLSKIAPTIKVGRKIKKGYTVGRVSRKLMFQATKNSKHINPMKLIKI
jgi:murein DD-endopeptidase MepM/ murein hydrolase activator NlpD